MTRPILNRDFKHPADGFYHIEAKGYHPASDGRKIVQVIDDKAVSSIASNFNQDAQAGVLRHGSEMLIDREHFALDPDKDSTAYGWMQQAQGRQDGVYARPRWTATGQSAVDGGDYRFFSTEYDPEQMENVPANEVPQDVQEQYPGWQFKRPLRLEGLSLTNMPNNGGQRAITNRRQASVRLFSRAGRSESTSAEPPMGADLARKIMNRAKELRAEDRHLSAPSAVIKAQREFESAELRTLEK